MDDKRQDHDDKRRTEDAVDRNLKRVYDDMIEDEVPERFAALLQQLREQGSSK